MAPKIRSKNTREGLNKKKKKKKENDLKWALENYSFQLQPQIFFFSRCFSCPQKFIYMN